MVCGDDDQGVVVDSSLAQSRCQPAEQSVDVPYLQQVPLVVECGGPLIVDPYAVLDADNAPVESQLLSRRQVEPRFVRQQGVHEVQRGSATTGDRLDETGDGLAPIAGPLRPPCTPERLPCGEVSPTLRHGR